MILSYDEMFDRLRPAVWEVWTQNGLHLDDDDKVQTAKSVDDALTNAYQEDMSLEEWQAAALKRLQGVESQE
jgi:hypothetical protein